MSQGLIEQQAVDNVASNDLVSIDILNHNADNENQLFHFEGFFSKMSIKRFNSLTFTFKALKQTA